MQFHHEERKDLLKSFVPVRHVQFATIFPGFIELRRDVTLPSGLRDPLKHIFSESPNTKTNTETKAKTNKGRP